MANRLIIYNLKPFVQSKIADATRMQKVPRIHAPDARATSGSQPADRSASEAVLPPIHLLIRLALSNSGSKKSLPFHSPQSVDLTVPVGQKFPASARKLRSRRFFLILIDGISPFPAAGAPVRHILHQPVAAGKSKVPTPVRHFGDDRQERSERQGRNRFQSAGRAKLSIV